jgi:protein-disulfide isomerase
MITLMEADRHPRRRVLWIVTGIGLLALVAVLIVVVTGPSEDGRSDIKLRGVAEVNEFFAGYTQNEAVIGEPLAPVETVLYGDLQSRPSKRHMEEVLPSILEKQVKQGATSIDFRFMSDVGKESIQAGAAAYAASLQGRGWNYIAIFYRNQRAENSGYAADDDFLEAVAEAAGVKDLDKWNDDRENSTTWAVENTEEGHVVDFRDSPGFTVRGPKLNEELEIVGVSPSAKALEDAIEGAH